LVNSDHKEKKDTGTRPANRRGKQSKKNNRQKYYPEYFQLRQSIATARHAKYKRNAGKHSTNRELLCCANHTRGIKNRVIERKYQNRREDIWQYTALKGYQLFPLLEVFSAPANKDRKEGKIILIVVSTYPCFLAKVK
jgi:hypothetical protein